jgi:hypothetical protein
MVHVNPKDISKISDANSYPNDDEMGKLLGAAFRKQEERIISQLWGLPVIETDTVPEGTVRLINGELRAIDMPISDVPETD